MHKESDVPLIGSNVSFRIEDVYLPDPAELVEVISEANEVVGKLVELSDRGTDRDQFGVVRLREDLQVIVAVDKLTVIQKQESS
jgi:hypothetical protein